MTDHTSERTEMIYGTQDEELDESRIDQIAKYYRDIYFQEEADGKFPNLGLIIRDALIEAWATRFTASTKRPTMPNNDFATRLEALMASIDAEPDALKRYALIQQRDALLANHAPAIAKVVRAMGQASFCLRELLPNDPDAKMTVKMIADALAELSAEGKT